MARLRMVNKNPGSTYTMSLKENIHIARSKRYLKYIKGLSAIVIIELVAIIYGVIKYVHIK
jgi:hypothetical protein